ncbi:hypothetical protein ILYODFUR_032638 [Ilyodon furcidens]|uniref:Uncharacterized protein n=1 Tax=Ilyodon furcidens TaxID=33524 RepID=A0ABV0UM09_9TELE
MCKCALRDSSLSGFSTSSNVSGMFSRGGFAVIGALGLTAEQSRLNVFIMTHDPASRNSPYIFTSQYSVPVWCYLLAVEEESCSILSAC